MNVHHKLTHALTEYDKKQSGKKSYNIHALPIYLERVEAVTKDIAAGADPRAAVIAGFSGSLQRICLKACGFAPADGQASGAGWCYEPVAAKA